MRLPLREVLVPKLLAAFPDAGMLVGKGDEPLFVFPAKHSEIGDLIIQDEGDEITVILGNITHRHFCSDSAELDASQRADRIATELQEYLRGLFADEIEFYGNGSKGGARSRSATKRGLLSKILLGKRSYVWSGPINNTAA